MPAAHLQIIPATTWFPNGMDRPGSNWGDMGNLNTSSGRNLFGEMNGLDVYDNKNLLEINYTFFIFCYNAKKLLVRN